MHVKNPPNKYMLYSQKIIYILLLHQIVLINPIQSRSVFITPSILPSRYIFRVIHFSLDLSIFLTPRKYGLFGVTCERIPRQVNFLIDEAVDMGKGANSICSMLHYFFSHHGLGEQTVHLNADNCVRQNKNNIVMQVHLITCMKK